jgi:hypothetical protein
MEEANVQLGGAERLLDGSEAQTDGVLRNSAG